jgi:hypothetical protein
MVGATKLLGVFDDQDSFSSVEAKSQDLVCPCFNSWIYYSSFLDHYFPS